MSGNIFLTIDHILFSIDEPEGFTIPPCFVLESDFFGHLFHSVCANIWAVLQHVLEFSLMWASMKQQIKQQ